MTLIFIMIVIKKITRLITVENCDNDVNDNDDEYVSNHDNRGS